MAILNTTPVAPWDIGQALGGDRVGSCVVRAFIPTLNTQYLEYCRWLYVGVSGDVSLVMPNGTSVTMAGVAAGVWHPIASVQINTTGTTATSILVGS